MAADDPVPACEVLPLEDRRILILYGSETGNSQDFAIDLEKISERLRFRADVFAMDSVGLLLQLGSLLGNIKTLTEYAFVLFVIATTGQGEMPKNSRLFWRKLLSKRLPATIFGGVKFTTFGLGDSSYQQYNWASRKLHKRLLQLGANEFYPRGEADERHEDGIDGAFLPWSISLRSHLISKYPLPEGLSVIPEDVQLPPKIILERLSIFTKMVDRFNEKRRLEGVDRNNLDCRAAHFSHVDAVDPLRQEDDLRDDRHEKGLEISARLNPRTSANAVKHPSGVDFLDRLNILKDDVEKYKLEDSAHPSGSPPQDLLPIPDAWTATIEENTRLTPEGHWQDVRHLKLVVHPNLTVVETALTSAKSKNESSGSQKGPSVSDGKVKAKHRKKLESLFTAAGDTVFLYPKNFPEDVQALIDLMGWNGVADEPFKHYKERYDLFPYEHAPPGCYPLEESTLRQLLTNNYDITAIPKRSFFDNIKYYATDDMQKERLSEFSEPRFIDEFYDYTTRPRRSILEILQDFSSVKLPYHFIPVVFPLIRGREYSMASSGPLMEVDGNKHDTRVELLVALVKYKTVLRKTRRGLCSRYIESLRPGTKIRISVGERRAPFANVDTMQRPLLGITTGTGVAPARAAFWERATNMTHGANVLFFGGRNRTADYYFQDDWSLLRVKVHTAFSRDQREKIYVQDVIRREYKLVCGMLQEGATIMICGSSGKMPTAVREALLDAMVKGELCKTLEDATAFLDSFCTIWQEVW
ncbi:hypothetical protein BKA67DRAFT_529707 [Truncatella angustata]|uniref:NADPH-dependent diflavin oxidoreductase 1 n=1 Tax=Truncatella angustata TaxID=152316 RepID=A0A9P8UX45_9PEZI|nr:uncharacterized protein BKA67DRAFT_529707 [Truncatella angustata]KAH6659564.1 hypothetical protein BKA67DRAFT_529707 [Truncatella angustata]